jgi:hypothetical protein
MSMGRKQPRISQFDPLLTKGALDTIHVAVASIYGLPRSLQLDATGIAETNPTEYATGCPPPVSTEVFLRRT